MSHEDETQIIDLKPKFGFQNKLPEQQRLVTAGNRSESFFSNHKGCGQPNGNHLNSFRFSCTPNSQTPYDLRYRPCSLLPRSEKILGRNSATETSHPKTDLSRTHLTRAPQNVSTAAASRDLNLGISMVHRERNLPNLYRHKPVF